MLLEFVFLAASPIWKRKVLSGFRREYPMLTFLVLGAYIELSCGTRISDEEK